MIKTVLNRFSSWILAALFTVLLGVSLQTQMVIAGLNDLGANIGLLQSLSMTAYDIRYLGQIYGLFTFIALLIAFLAGGLLYHFIKFGRRFIYAVAGGTAMLVLLFSMKKVFFNIHMIAGASEALGISLQVFAGLVGGLLFARLSEKKSPA